jgi:hypothetical protein
MAVEWLTYVGERLDDEIEKNKCTTDSCPELPSVLRYLNQEAGPEPMCDMHARENGWNGTALGLGEGELITCAQFAGEPSHYEGEYDGFVAGATLNLTTEPGIIVTQEQKISFWIDRIIDGEHEISDAPGTPPCKLFEGVVLESSHYMFKVDEQAFGVIFPGGFVSVVDGDPLSDYTNRRMAAGMIMSGS